MRPEANAVSEAVRAAAARRARLYPRGSGSWWPDAPPGARMLELSSHADLTRLDAADLMATAGAGSRLDALAGSLAEAGAWLALDPPGSPTRSLGGALAAGGGGPLSAGFGPPRDQVLGMTLVAGNGTVVRFGGRVVKNVAGFDLGKVVIGGHGGFGIIVEVHLRLRARPEADRTRAWAGPLAGVASAAARLIAAGCAPAALEVLHPDLATALGAGDAGSAPAGRHPDPGYAEGDWVLALRAIGTAPGVEEELDAAARAVEAAPGCREVGFGEGDDARAWTRWRTAVGAWPVVLRVGTDPAAWADALALACEHAGAVLGASVTVPRGTVRIGAATLAPAAIADLRQAAARRGWPVTLERADAATRAAAGVWGALPAGALQLTRALRAAFDPDSVFDVPLL